MTSDAAAFARGSRLHLWIASIIEPPEAVFARNIEPGDRQSH
jgi:hypothetical protein